MRGVAWKAKAVNELVLFPLLHKKFPLPDAVSVTVSFVHMVFLSLAAVTTGSGCTVTRMVFVLLQLTLSTVLMALMVYTVVEAGVTILVALDPPWTHE
jgi:hypothetical protein